MGYWYVRFIVAGESINQCFHLSNLLVFTLSITVSEIPSPPLADAPVCNVSSFRGCVRPVTMSISDKQKILRHQL
jgi:hypothetical protein